MATAWALGLSPTAFRDMVHGGRHVITGTVKVKTDAGNVPVRRRVRLVRDIDGLLIRATWSDAVTGWFTFAGISGEYRYTTYAQDHAGNYRAVIADRITAEVGP